MEPVQNVPLADFAARTAGLSEEEFLAAYRAPFLLVERETGATDSGEFQTLHADGPSEGLATRPGPVVSLEEGDKFVWTLEKSGRNSFPGMITVGRAVNNDIVLSNPSVSKFHAIFSADKEGGGFTLRDVGSTNGTRMGDDALEENRKTPLSSGTRVVFGDALAATYFPPADFHAFLLLLRRASGG